MSLHCDTLVVHCIDYRLQGYLNKWLENNLPVQSYDRVAIAGGVNDVFYVIGQVDVAVRLHSIKRVIFINHENCARMEMLAIMNVTKRTSKKPNARSKLCSRIWMSKPIIYIWMGNLKKCQRQKDRLKKKAFVPRSN